MKIFFLLFVLFQGIYTTAQSFNDDKTAALNYIKRVYSVSPFEGAKKLEGDNGNYYVVTVSYQKIAKDSISIYSKNALQKAQIYAEQSFAEPCIKFEMIEAIDNKYGSTTTFMYICETLGDFVLNILKKKPFDGSRIISTPTVKYVISVVTMDNSKYTSSASMDKVSQMKAKQMVNSLVNGSTITSDIVIRTDDDQSNSDVPGTEYIREQSMGFINGLELLTTKQLNEGKTTYVYFSKI